MANAAMRMIHSPLTVLFSVLFVFLFVITPVFAQHEHIARDMPGMQMEANGMYGSYPMTREASGTSWQPESSPMTGFMEMQPDGMFMLDAYVNLIQDHQGGARGEDKVFSQSMFMVMAQKNLQNSTVGWRGMMSLDPAMGEDGYPLLLQTGETADGQTPLIDRQHPHDLFMELAATYSYALDEDNSLFAYAGLPGEPALGPPAFMHRFSGRDNPEAPISHHWLDATHITFGVLTLGYTGKYMKVEGSSFRGREPDEHRWDIESPELDSYAGRWSLNPTPNIALQVSYGVINSPEKLEPDIDTCRYTTSLIYNKDVGPGTWQTTIAWGRNDKKPGANLDAYLVESALQVHEKHTLFGRYEDVQKDELFLEDEPLHGRVFDVDKITLGYVYDFRKTQHLLWGIGGTLSAHFLPADLDASYGEDPFSHFIFVRVKLI